MRTSLMLLSFVGCSPSPQLATIDHTPRVEVLTVERAPDSIQRTAHGVVEPLRDTLLSARLGGVFDGHEVKPGDSVRTGDRLATFDAREARAQVALTEAGVSEAEAIHADAVQSLSRVEALGDGASASQRDSATLGVARAAAAVTRAHAQQDLAAVQLDHHTLRAPFDGHVSWIDGEVGETVAPGTPLVRVVQADPLRVEFGLLGDEIVAAQDTESRFVVQVADFEQQATLTHVAVAADPRTLDWPAEVRLSPHPAMPPGTPVTIALQLHRPTGGVLIPATSITNDTVHVVVNDTIEQREVRVLGEHTDDLIVDGLTPGDVVVVRATSNIQVGSQVQILRDVP